jgi:hypothetical protein
MPAACTVLRYRGTGTAGALDEGGAAGWKVDGDGEPAGGQAGAHSGEVAAVLVVAAAELDIVEFTDDPDVGGVELGEGGQAGRKLGW